MSTSTRFDLRARAAGALLVSAALAALPAALPAQTPCGSAHLVPIPLAQPTTRSLLWSVAAAGPRDYWAVGTRAERVGTQTEGFSLILHGDGESWIEVPAPSPAVAPGFRECELFAVAAVSASEVYAAGWKLIAFPNNGHLGPQIFVLRWDGLQWSEIPAPIPFFSYMASASGSRVLDIEVAGPNDLWFFGWWSGDQVSAAQPLALHYDGASFTRHDLPLPLTRREIIDARAFASNDIWALGRPTFGGTSPSTYLVHWDGASWTQVPLLLSPFASYEPYALDGISTSDFWISGYETAGSTGAVTGFALHWVGGSFVKYPLRGISKHLVALSANEVWSFGTTIERWDGVRWNLVDELSGTASGQLNGAAGLASCDFQAVGSQWLGAAGQVFPLGARVDPTSGARATLRLPCTGAELRSCFLAERAPAIGQDLVLAIGDPARETGIAPGGALTFWMLSPRAPAPAPCGIPLPGFGPNGSSAELLIDPSTGFASFGPVAWTSHAAPALHRARVPPLPYLVGQTVFAQALLVGGGSAVLSAGLELRIGR